MQIFCDESGGSGQDHFVTAAVRLESKQADRLAKEIKSALKIKKNEIHAKDLTDAQLIKVLDIIYSLREVAPAVSVICGRTTPLEGWAMGHMAENQLWKELVVESCLPLMTGDVTSIHPDTGRYKSSVMTELEKKISEDLSRRANLPPRNVKCRESHLVSGIQIADVISHSVYRCLTGCAEVDAIEKKLFEMESCGQLTRVRVRLVEARPDWLVVEPGDDGGLPTQGP